MSSSSRRILTANCDANRSCSLYFDLLHRASRQPHTYQLTRLNWLTCAIYLCFSTCGRHSSSDGCTTLSWAARCSGFRSTRWARSWRTCVSASLRWQKTWSSCCSCWCVYLRWLADLFLHSSSSARRSATQRLGWPTYRVLLRLPCGYRNSKCLSLCMGYLCICWWTDGSSHLLCYWMSSSWAELSVSCPLRTFLRRLQVCTGAAWSDLLNWHHHYFKRLLVFFLLDDGKDFDWTACSSCICWNESAVVTKCLSIPKTASWSENLIKAI